MSDSSDVTPGTNGTVDQYNNLRKDAIKRQSALVWEVEDAVAILDDQGGHYLIPFDCTVVEIYGKVDSGSCTIRLQRATSDIKNSMNITDAGDSYTTSFSITALSKGDKISLDVTGSSSGSGLIVLLICTRNL